MLKTLLIEFVVAVFATGAFSVLFSVPRRQWIFAGITGGAGWIVYRGLTEPAGIVAATFAAAVAVTLMARCLAVARRSPVTVFLVPGIFPLVPGVGIYYTSYYFVMNDFAAASAKGVETLKLAVAITLGIMCVLLVPQKLFMLLEGRRREN